MDCNEKFIDEIQRKILYHKLEINNFKTEDKAYTILNEFKKDIHNYYSQKNTQNTQSQNENLNIETAPELNDIIKKLSDKNLITQGSFPTDKKIYSYKIKTSVKDFVKELKNMNLTDESSKTVIFNSPNFDF